MDPKAEAWDEDLCRPGAKSLLLPRKITFFTCLEATRHRRTRLYVPAYGRIRPRLRVCVFACVADGGFSQIISLSFSAS